MKIPKMPHIPVIGFRGLLFIIGFIIGVVVNKMLEGASAGNETLSKELFGGFKVVDLISIGIPIGLIVFLKKYRSVFIGWLVGATATELIDIANSLSGS